VREVIGMFSDHMALVEPVVIRDTFVSGLARIEDVGGGNFRFTFYTTQRSTLFTDERVEHVVVARIVMPKDAVTAANAATLAAIKGVSGIIGKVVVDRSH
jgi:hypothetical protein